MIHNIHDYAYDGNSEKVKECLASGVDINDQNQGTLDTPLLDAIYKQRIETVKLLLEHGANIYITNNQQSTPLYLAISLLLKSIQE